MPTNDKIRDRSFKAALLYFLLVFLASFTITSRAQETILKVFIVYGAPGHSSIHLQRGGEQLFWDPGGSYGTEMNECVDLSYDTAHTCGHLEGFPWEAIQTGRRYDVFSGDLANLMRVISIYHLDGDRLSTIYTYHLNSNLGEQAWNMIKQGSMLGRKAEFKTNRKPFLCARSTTEYLQLLGGPFEGIGRAWTPKGFAKQMKRIGAQSSHVYTLQSPEVQAYISETRRRAGLAPLPQVVSVTSGSGS